MGIATHCIGEQSAIFITHIARRRTNETRHGVLLGIFTHVEAQQLHPHFFSQHFGHFRFTHSSGTHKQKRRHGFTLIRQSSARQQHSLGHSRNGLILTENLTLHSRFERLQIRHFACFHIAQAFHLANAGQHFIDECLAHHLIFSRMHLTIGCSFINEVNGFVGKSTIIDESRSTMHGMTHSTRRKGHVVETFVARLQALEDAHRLINGGFGHIDGLETAHQSSVTRNVSIKLFVSSCSHKSNATFFQEGFEHICRIHSPIGGASCPHNGVNLIDIHNRVVDGEQTVHNQLPAFLKISAILRPCQERTHIEGENLRIFQAFWHFSGLDFGSKSINQSCFSHTRVAHVERIVFIATTKHTNGALQFVFTTNERIALLQMVVHARYPFSPIVRIALSTF